MWMAGNADGNARCSVWAGAINEHAWKICSGERIFGTNGKCIIKITKYEGGTLHTCIEQKFCCRKEATTGALDRGMFFGYVLCDMCDDIAHVCFVFPP